MTALLAAVPETFSPAQHPAAVEPPARVVALVVEDDPLLGRLFSVLLERCGLRAMHASDGAACLRLYAEHRDAVALVVMDCRLPDAHGGSLCHHLRAADPGLPVLLTSGRKQDALHALLAADGPTGFLPKPFFPADVLREVRALVPAARLG